MKTRFRFQLWVRTVLAFVAICLAVVTSVWPQWIEQLFRVDPDGGSGAAEWTLVGAVWVAAALSSGMAIRGWRKVDVSENVGK
jgi:hypothetical protein